MANYATNIFHASTENKQDLDKIEAFLDDNFNGFVNRYGDTVDAVSYTHLYRYRAERSVERYHSAGQH